MTTVSASAEWVKRVGQKSDRVQNVVLQILYPRGVPGHPPYDWILPRFNQPPLSIWDSPKRGSLVVKLEDPTNEHESE